MMRTHENSDDTDHSFLDQCDELLPPLFPQVDYRGAKHAPPEQEYEEVKRYRSLFNNSLEGIFFTTPDGRYLDVNPTLARIYGFSTPEQLIRHFKDIKHQLYVRPERRDEFISILERDKRIIGFESQVRKRNGEIIWISENARPVYNPSGGISYYEGTVMDITARKEAEEELELQRAFFSQLFDNSPQAIVIIDTKRNVVNCNQGFERLFGYRAVDIIGFGMRALIVPEGLMVECENVRNTILSGETVQCETQRRHRNGSMIPVDMIGFPIQVGSSTSGIIYIYEDISERKSFEEQITHQAFHDSLTGLPNRTLFGERLERALERSHRRPELYYSVLMIDLNKFKAVNDSLGHPAGDQLLIEVGQRLSVCVRSVDTVARLGGDEFALILEEFPARKELLKIARRMHSILCEPFSLYGNEITPGASIGIVAQLNEYTSAEEVLRDADIAMYRAKQQGKGIVLFDKRMHLELVESINLEAELRETINNGALTLHYQPIVAVDTEQLLGFEALVRWDHPMRGMVPPDRFIPLAEETGLIIDLGKWVISEACHTLKVWQDDQDHARRLTMSVNVSCRQLADAGLVEHVTAVLRKENLAPANLKIEVTESVIMHDVDSAISELNRLRELGVQIAIDDFGTGYSSLAYLRRIPIDHLKIDRSFIRDFSEGNKENDQIVRSIISLARSLGLGVIAEGVENRDQLDRLRSLNCDRAQGFMFSRPVDRTKAATMIRQYAASQVS
ncbi:EAL domain-containing protein [Desulfobulbus rhabdoformis]|uniref:putative bifunctional diguanylate cyclase/phosphodiesterase n=1 Tax=Desulfobulbus rhabdoformis TaxID=34032 RepID=UPI00196256AB|nr:EAL domain-containing protein [Desulfobulbus rhabdoformis]MBM9614916.1 EAL domain-containing protein [Desulfobulbus rhabdoformis]